MATLCWSCNTEITESPVMRKTICPQCGRSVRCCKNCQHYAPAHSKQCLISDIEAVSDKTYSNFCDYFKFIDRDKSNAPNAGEDIDDARKKLNDFFK